MLERDTVNLKTFEEMLNGYCEFEKHLHLFPECDVDGTIVDKVKMDVLFDFM